MNENVERLLSMAAVRTFEDMCYLYVEPELRADEQRGAIETAAEVKFRGDFNGNLVLATTTAVSHAIAAQMLGTEKPDAQQQQDALCEVVNIICGNLIPGLITSGRLCQIETPRIIKNVKGYQNLFGAPIVIKAIDLDPGRVFFWLYIDGYFPAR